ncbi:MAG: tRNA (N6-isopentenyl adenosine(37)-C2)-methylthiotransferase MiaB [Candidatus Schekmanbacteria bacterium RBG_13_48_7]|uniref:tRNA-2-methylthio-N(6)-dimethylallyladenosine synthase n=1 Tax=Candidatus Schekmanbacteria bacterium RBG_13_48_7 TaxID=1817878 RepID=A0A1F7RU46_9BACT|nr:MAG: tRNA (N6-isopentenyl adenosine(37)-C2)-methylthiotransferase MiaB [Candidatus Schekmanbacteria bacterium RBG_13_48_7]
MKFYLETFGCQMNVHDSERITWLLLQEGFKKADNPSSADLILLNTCSIREKAEHKVFSRLGRLFILKKSNSSLKFGVIGCMAQSYGNKLLRRFPLLSFVIGPDSISSLPEIIRNELETGLPQVETKFNSSDHPGSGSFLPDYYGKTFISIMRGCNNYCSYCIVPYVRGPEISRPAHEILEEVEQLVDAGYKEIILLGQNVNSYLDTGKSTVTFARLLSMLNGIKGLERIRFMTSHPKDFTEDIIEAIYALEKVCEHVHLPIQAGSNKILAAMHREYTCEQYLKKIELLRKRIDNVAITTDIIVGFPGEDDQDFLKTVKLLEEVRFDSIFAFQFSKRKGTRAYTFDETVPESVKRSRLNEVNQLQKEISESINKTYIGTNVEIFIDEYCPKKTGLLSGRTRTDKIVFCSEQPDLLYTFRDILIESASPYALKGVILSDGERH